MDNVFGKDYSAGFAIKKSGDIFISGQVFEITDDAVLYEGRTAKIIDGEAWIRADAWFVKHLYALNKIASIFRQAFEDAETLRQETWAMEKRNAVDD